MPMIKTNVTLQKSGKTYRPGDSLTVSAEEAACLVEQRGHATRLAEKNTPHPTRKATSNATPKVATKGQPKARKKT